MHSGQYWKQENISDDLHIGTFYNTEGSRYVLNLDGTFKYSAREKKIRFLSPIDTRRCEI